MKNAGLDEAQAGIKIAGKVKVKVAQLYSTLQSQRRAMPKNVQTIVQFH